MMKQLPKPFAQRGAATLIVVMMLFIVMALLAAYANRSLLFEQRIAGSYARATLAQETGEAAIEWAVTMLNGPAVDAACKPADAPAGQRFLDRYFKVSSSDRGIAPLVSLEFVADCTRDGEGWTCRCPAVGARVAPESTAGDGLVPSFGVAFMQGKRPGVILVKPQGCTDSVVDNCGSTTESSRRQLGTSPQRAQLSLVSAARTPPAAPLVAKGDLKSPDGKLGLHNADPRTAGMLLVLGGTAVGLVGDRLESLPGTPPAMARMEGDTVVKNNDVFPMFMGMKRTRYLEHPALHVVTCDANCTGPIEAAYKQGWRMLWVKGPMTLSDGVNVGTETDPVVVVADGAVNLNNAVQITGLLVSLGKLTWTNATALPSVVTGSVVVDGAVETDGLVDIVYRQQVSDQLRNRLGSFVRVPGGWVDE